MNYWNPRTKGKVFDLEISSLARVVIYFRAILKLVSPECYSKVDKFRISPDPYLKKYQVTKSVCKVVLKVDFNNA